MMANENGYELSNKATLTLGHLVTTVAMTLFGFASGAFYNATNPFVNQVVGQKYDDSELRAKLVETKEQVQGLRLKMADFRQCNCRSNPIGAAAKE